VDVSDVTVWDVDVTYSTEYVTVSGKTSIYELQDIFADSSKTEVVIVTNSGKESEKILALVSVHDLAHLQEKYLRLPSKK
jgi:CBS domain-containing protein